MKLHPCIYILFFVPVFSGCQKDDITNVRLPKESQPTMTVPAMDNTGMDMPPADNRNSSEDRGIHWTLPSGWAEQPPSMMRVGSFLAPGKNGMKADISVVPLSGEAGGDLANVNRWRGQINLAPITEAELKTQREIIKPAGRSMLLVNYLSQDMLIDNRYKKRLMATIYKEGGTTWFFKVTGEDSAVLDVKPAFLKFLESLKFSHP